MFAALVRHLPCQWRATNRKPCPNIQPACKAPRGGAMRPAAINQRNCELNELNELNESNESNVSDGMRDAHQAACRADHSRPIRLLYESLSPNQIAVQAGVCDSFSRGYR
eukprot:1180761-Prorocentrum_minimum.AAC.1